MSVRSCADCVSCISAGQSRETMKVDVGADLCYSFGHVLSRPGQPPALDEKIKTSFAENCPNYVTAVVVDGPIVGVVPSPILTAVAVGDPSIHASSGGTGADKPTSCAQCRHYVKPGPVQAELGWTVGMCAARGRLLPATKLIKEAAICPMGIVGTPRDSTAGVMLLPQYELGTPTTVRVTSASFSVKDQADRHRVDPREYVTDKEVTPAEAAAPNHVRAWRRVDDPEGLRDPRYLPIFDGPALCGYDPRTTYSNYRPDLYVDHQGLLWDLTCEMWPEHGKADTPLLIGGAGLGKTEIGCWFAWLLDIPYHCFPINKGTEIYHFVGEGHLDVREVDGTQHSVTVFRKGNFVEAFEKPGVIMVDEPNLNASVFEFLRPITAGARTLDIAGAQGLTTTAHPLNFLMLAQNPSDDPIYIGTEPINAADMNRLSPVHIGLPPEAIERQIIQMHCRDAGYDIPTLMLDKIMQIAKELRDMIDQGTLQIAWGIRSQVKVARKTEHYSLVKAYKRALLDGLDSSVAQHVMKIVEAHA